MCLAFALGEPCLTDFGMCRALLGVFEWAWIETAWDAVFEVDANFLVCVGDISGLWAAILCVLTWILWILLLILLLVWILWCASAKSV